MIFELAQGFHDAVAAMPREHPKHRMLELLEEAVCRDIHFIDRHSTALFQCMWNTCWWYDCPEAAEHYEDLAERETGLPWLSGGVGLHLLMERWRDARDALGACPWVQSLLPPRIPLDSGQRLVLGSEGRTIHDVAFSPDGRIVAGGLSGGRIARWSLPDGRELPSLDSHSGNHDIISAVAWSPCGRYLAGLHNGRMRLSVWLPGEERRVARFEMPRLGLGKVFFLGAGDILSVGAIRNGMLCLWRLDTQELLMQYAMDIPLGHPPPMCAVSPQGDILAMTTGSGEVHVIETATGQIRHPLKCAPGTISCLHFAPDGRTCVVGSRGDVMLLDTESGRCAGAKRLTGEAASKYVTCAAVSPCGRYVALGIEIAWSTVRIWDRKTDRVWPMAGHATVSFCLAFSPDGRLLASGSTDGKIRLWEWRQASSYSLRSERTGVRNAAFSGDGQRLVTWDSHSGGMVWELDGDEGTAACKEHVDGNGSRTDGFSCGAGKPLFVSREISSGRTIALDAPIGLGKKDAVRFVSSAGGCVFTDSASGKPLAWVPAGRDSNGFDCYHPSTRTAAFVDFESQLIQVFRLIEARVAEGFRAPAGIPESRDRILRISDIERLRALWQETGRPSTVRAAAAERLIELGTVAAYMLDETQRRKVYALVARMVENTARSDLRAVAVGVVYDPNLLYQLASDPYKRVARAARKRIEWLNAGLKCRVEQDNGLSSATVVVGIGTGFCATTAMYVVKEVARYGRPVTIERPGEPDNAVANGVSVIDLMALNAEQGVRLRIQAEGDDARARRLVLNLCGILESPDVKHLWLDRHLVEQYR